MSDKAKTSYNRVVATTTPFVTAAVVISLFAAGTILLEWISVENTTILGWFLVAQATTLMVYGFQKATKQE